MKNDGGSAWSWKPWRTWRKRNRFFMRHIEMSHSYRRKKWLSRSLRYRLAYMRARHARRQHIYALFAAGMVSTMPQFSMKHPQEVLEQIIADSTKEPRHD